MTISHPRAASAATAATASAAGRVFEGPWEDLTTATSKLLLSLSLSLCQIRQVPHLPKTIRRYLIKAHFEIISGS